MRSQRITLSLLLLLILPIAVSATQTRNQGIAARNIESEEIPLPNSSEVQRPMNQNLKISSISGAESEPSVDIFWVGLNKSDGSEIEPVGGTYDINTGFAISPIQIRVKMTGYTSFSFGNVTLPNIATPVSLGDSSTTLGQAFLIINHEVLMLTMNEITQKTGFSIVLPLGNHIITVLYMTMDQNGEIAYALDNINVRLRELNENFDLYTTISLPLKYQVTDLFEEKIISLNAVEQLQVLGSFDSYQRVFSLNRQNNEIKLRLDLTVLNDTSEIAIDLEDVPQLLNITGAINSTGFNGIQLMDEWPSSQGITFFIDAAGMHNQIPAEATIRKGLNHLGVITFSPYGFWHRNITFPDGTGREGNQNGLPDWDWVANNYITSDEDLNSRVTFDSSFDFQSFFTGITISINFGEAETVTSKTEESPAFASLILILSINFILLVKRATKNWGDN